MQSANESSIVPEPDKADATEKWSKQIIDLKDLEDGTHYVVEFPFTSERGDVQRTVAKFEDGRWLTTNEDAYEDDPPPAESSIFTAVAKIDLWAD